MARSVLTLAERGARAIERGSLAALAEAGWSRHGASGPNEDAGLLAQRELVILVPGADPAIGRRAATAVLHELEASLPGFILTVARSRHTADRRALTERAPRPVAATWRRLAACSTVVEETGADRRLRRRGKDPGAPGFFDRLSPPCHLRRAYEPSCRNARDILATATSLGPRKPSRTGQTIPTDGASESSPPDVSSTDARTALTRTKACASWAIHPGRQATKGRKAGRGRTNKRTDRQPGERMRRACARSRCRMHSCSFRNNSVR